LSGTSGSRSRTHAQGDRIQGGRTQSRVYYMTQEKTRAVSDVVAGTLQLNSLLVHVLFDLGATHSFVANKLVGGLRKNPCRIENGFIISTLLIETVNVDHIYKGV